MWILRRHGQPTLVSPTEQEGYITFPILQYSSQTALLLSSENEDGCYSHYTDFPKFGVYQEAAVLSAKGETGPGKYLAPSKGAAPPSGTYPHGTELSVNPEEKVSNLLVNQAALAEAQERDLLNKYANKAYHSRVTAPIRTAWLGQAQRMEGCKTPS
jgi:hypothetical protein